MGGEAAHGVLILSPRAMERLNTHIPTWPVPKILRLANKGQIIYDLFEGVPLNTVSFLCIEDYIDSLIWAKSIGGLSALCARTEKNFSILDDFVNRVPWLDYLTADPALRSHTSVCLRIVDSDLMNLPKAAMVQFCKNMVEILQLEGAAYDIGSYRAAPPGLRIWTGATVEAENLQDLLPWLEWAFATEKAKFLVRNSSH